LTPLAALAALLAAVPAHVASCPAQHLSPSYVRSVDRALRSGRDVWGDGLLRAPAGPTYDGVRRRLKPLLYAKTTGGRRLTASGVYYLPFAQPLGIQGAGTAMLHVADGSQILVERAGGRSLTVRVHGERYGFCPARLAPARLAGGWLPILETAYAGYRQESFAARRPDGSLASFVRVTGPGRVGLNATTLALPAHATWGGGRVVPVDAARYDEARRSVSAYWEKRLAEGTTFVVPERRVLDAERALLVQNLELTWRYSIGNPYEEFSFPESLDVAQVLAEYGHDRVSAAIVRTSLGRRPTPYPNWKMGEKLVSAALLYRLSGNPAYVEQVTPALRGYVAALGRKLGPRGILGRERYSSDIPDLVYGLHSQAVAWQGLRSMAAVWARTGHAGLARTSGRLAARLETGLRRAVRESQRRLPDGSLFLPVRLLEREEPYGALTSSRAGSYWNLVAPYALASGLFPPRGPQATGALRYLLGHGSRFLGLVRAGAFSLYGSPVFPASGSDQVYGLNAARFLADNDQADQLVLSLYGQLAAGMTPGTFVAGEGATIAPLRGEAYRSMYLPPNAASNAAFLETLRLTLVHETPTGLELAYATPRAWLGPGKRIEVRGAPTSFGPLSYTLDASASSVHASIEVPARVLLRTLSLRLRLPAGRRIATVTLDGKPYSRFNAATQTISLPPRTGSLDLVVSHSQK